MAASKYDLNRYRKVYPLFRTKPVYDEILMLGGVQTEATILTYNNSFEETYVFTKNYTEIPVISATPEDENVNVYITNLSTTSVTIQASSAFTGKVHIQIFKIESN
jgi:hypothetical protein